MRKTVPETGRSAVLKKSVRSSSQSGKIIFGVFCSITLLFRGGPIRLIYLPRLMLLNESIRPRKSNETRQRGLSVFVDAGFSFRL